MSGVEPGDEEADVLAELTGLILSEQTVSGLLDMIVNVAISGIEGVSGASISLLVPHGEQLETITASSETIRDIDQAQYQDDAGPCVQAIRTGQEVKVAMPAPDWAAFTDQAVQAGVRQVWSLPLQVRERSTGALNLYSTTTSQTWPGPAVEAARGQTRQAAVVLANAAALMSARLRNQQLEQAVETRDLIGQAKGILMAARPSAPTKPSTSCAGPPSAATASSEMSPPTWWPVSIPAQDRT